MPVSGKTLKQWLELKRKTVKDQISACHLVDSKNLFTGYRDLNASEFVCTVTYGISIRLTAHGV